MADTCDCGDPNCLLATPTPPPTSTEDTPVCAHCGEPFDAFSGVTTTPGGSKPDHAWHLGRTACTEAAVAHHALIQTLGRIVPPDFHGATHA